MSGLVAAPGGMLARFSRLVGDAAARRVGEAGRRTKRERVQQIRRRAIRIRVSVQRVRAVGHAYREKDAPQPGEATRGVDSS